MLNLTLNSEITCTNSEQKTVNTTDPCVKPQGFILNLSPTLSSLGNHFKKNCDNP